MFKYWFIDLLKEIDISDDKIEEWITPFNDFIEEYLYDFDFEIDEEILKRIRPDYRSKFLSNFEKKKTNIIKKKDDENFSSKTDELDTAMENIDMIENDIEDKIENKIEDNNEDKGTFNWLKGFLF